MSDDEEKSKVKQPDKMRSGVKRKQRLLWKNTSPGQQDAPRLFWFNSSWPVSSIQNVLISVKPVGLVEPHHFFFSPPPLLSLSSSCGIPQASDVT